MAADTSLCWLRPSRSTGPPVRSSSPDEVSLGRLQASGKRLARELRSLKSSHLQCAQPRHRSVALWNLPGPRPVQNQKLIAHTPAKPRYHRAKASIPSRKLRVAPSVPSTLFSKDRSNVERKLEMRQPEKSLEWVRRNRRLILGWVQLISEVHPNRPYRRGIPKAKTNRMRKIIQIRSGRRLPRNGYVVHIAVHVAAIVKYRAAQTAADKRKLHRKSQFLVEHEHCKSADREARARIPWTGFIQAETPKRCCAAGKKPLRQRNHLLPHCGSRQSAVCRAAFRRSAFDGLAQWLFEAKTGGPREHECSAERMKRRVLKKTSKKTCAGTE